MFPRETHGFFIWGVALLGDLRGYLADHRERHACCCAVPSGLEDLRDRNRDRSYRRKNINSKTVKHSKTVKPCFLSVHSWNFRIASLTIVFLPLKFQKYGWTWHENTFVYLSLAFFSRISTSQISFYGDKKPLDSWLFKAWLKSIPAVLGWWIQNGSIKTPTFHNFSP